MEKRLKYLLSSDERVGHLRLRHHGHPGPVPGRLGRLHRPEVGPVRHLLVRLCIRRPLRFAARKGANHILYPVYTEIEKLIEGLIIS